MPSKTPSKCLCLVALLMALTLIGSFASAVGAQPVAAIPDPVAKVNGQPISKAQYLQRLSDYYGVFVLENMIGEALIEAEAKKRGVTVTEQEISDRLEKYKKDLGTLSPESFRSWLQQNEMTESHLRERARLEVTIEKTFANEAVVKDSEVENLYNSRKSSFVQPAKVKLWTLRARTEEAAKKAVDLIRAGKSLPDAAKELGQTVIDFSSQAGVLPIQTLPITVKPAIERSSPGEIVGPIKQPENQMDPNSPAIAYLIFRIEEKIPERVMSYNEVKDELRQGLFNQRLFGDLGIWRTWMDREMQKATIERLITFSGEPKPGAASPQ